MASVLIGVQCNCQSLSSGSSRNYFSQCREAKVQNVSAELQLNVSKIANNPINRIMTPIRIQSRMIHIS
jgi:hypothetical protein